MKRILLLSAILILLVSGAEARTKLSALPERDQVTIRFDNPGATLVEEERILTLQKGINLIDFSWRGVQIDPDSIRLSFISHPDQVTLLAVSYPPREAALVWKLHSAGAWEERVRISYLLAQIDRLVAYRALAAKDEKTLDLEGVLILRNFSGEDFDNAAVRIGRENPFAGKIANEETKRMRFLSVHNLPVKKILTWDAAQQPWDPSRLEQNIGIPVHYEIENDKKTGLGKGALWGGKVRVFQDDGHGGTIFLGEDNTGITPVGEKLKITIGESRDVSVTQHKTRELQTNHRPSKYKVALYDTDEVIDTKIQNFKDQSVTVDLIQHIPGEWKMVEASMAYERLDVSAIVFHLDLPGNATQQISFHYKRHNVRP